MLWPRLGIFEENSNIAACLSRKLELNQCYLSWSSARVIMMSNPLAN